MPVAKASFVAQAEFPKVAFPVWEKTLQRSASNAPVSFGVREIAPLIPRFLRSHPGMTIDLGLNDRRVDLIEEGWDIAVGIGEMEDLSLIARKLAPVAPLCALRLPILREKGTPKTIAELAVHNCLRIHAFSERRHGTLAVRR